MPNMKNSGIPWIGEIPEKWRIERIKHHFTIVSGATPKSDNLNYWNGGIPWITPADFKTEDKYISAGRKSLSEEGYNSCGTTYVPAGSIVFSKRAPVGTVAIATNTLCTNQGCLSCVVKDDSNTTFYYYSMSVFNEQFDLMATGTTFKEIAADVFADFLLPTPTIPEQLAIATYLDIECARIDAVMEQTRASIEEYKKLKQSIITEAVTKGIRPNRPMKDSGIDWIGQIPAEWNVQRIKSIFTLRDERNYLPLEEVNLISLYTDKGVVQHADLEQTTGNKASNADGYKKVYPNDIVVNIILCWMGAIGRSDYEGVTSPAYDIYIPDKMIDSRYYHHYFRTQGFSGECYKRGKGIMAMRWRTYSDQFRDIPVLVPPIEEQKEILRYLDDTSNKMDTLITKKEQFLSEMESYKKSLIFEYVTGKKEV